VLELIINVVSSTVLGNESDIIRNMNLFGKVLDIETAVNYLSIFFTWFIKSYQERPCKSVHETLWKF